MTAPGGSARLSIWAALAFAATSLPLQALQISAAVHLPAYFAASLGMELAAVGAAFGLVRLIDVPIEPALGLAMDRTRTRFGRYRIWTLAGAPILMVGLYMLLLADPSDGRGYLIGWLLVLYIGVSILMLSHQAWASTLAKSYDDRARLFGVMISVGVAGAVGVLLIPIVMERQGASDAEAVQTMIWTMIVLTPVAVLIVAGLTPEVMMREPDDQRFRLRDYVELIFDPNMFRILLADLALSLGPVWMAALYLFYSKDYMGFTSGQANILLAVYILAGVAGAPVLAWVATKLSKHRTVMLAAVSYSLLLCSLAILPKGSLVAALPTLFLTGFMASGFNVLTRAMTADVADEMRLRQGKERSGLLYALTSLTSKLAGGVSIWVTLTVLAQTGYDPKLGSGNSPEAIDALLIAFLSGPVVFVMLGATTLIGYRLTAERAAEVRRQLEARDAFDPGAALEGLTGAEIPPPVRP